MANTACLLCAWWSAYIVLAKDNSLCALVIPQLHVKLRFLTFITLCLRSWGVKYVLGGHILHCGRIWTCIQSQYQRNAMHLSRSTWEESCCSEFFHQPWGICSLLALLASSTKFQYCGQPQNSEILISILTKRWKINETLFSWSSSFSKIVS